LRKSLERVYPRLMWPPVSLSDLGEREATSNAATATPREAGAIA